MKSKSIKSILGKKFREFAATITDPHVQKLVERDSIITGGSIASMLLNEKVNDYDIYFSTKETAYAVALYYASKFDPAGAGKLEVRNFGGRIEFAGTALGASRDTRMDADEFEDSGAQEAVDAAPADGTYRVLFLSPNAITLSDQIQIIVRFHGDADKIHENYDFVHCTNYWTSKDGEVVLRHAALEALLTKELRYIGSKYPLCSIIRTRKFIFRGWRINAGQYLKMALQLNELDLLDIEILKDQLIGVDSAHFIDLIDRIKQGDPAKINAAYVCEIIDRIF